MADPQAPWTSGSEILANPGNANLASGSGAGSLPIQIDTKPIYSVLDRLGDEDVKMRFQKQAQDREDRAALSQTLSDITNRNGSVFNMKGANGTNMSMQPLPDDEKVLEADADELRKMVVNNPDNYDTDRTYQRKLQEYKYKIQHAGERAALYAKNRIDAQGAINQDDRAGYLKTNQTEILDHPLNELYKPQSYIPQQTVDRSTYFDPKLLSDKNNFETTSTIGKNPNDPNDAQDYEITTSHLKNAILDVRKNVAPGTKAWTEGAKDYVTTTRILKDDPAAAAQVEQNILKINKERGLDIKPFVTVKDGQVLFTTLRDGTPDIANFVGAIVAEGVGQESRNMKPTKLPEEEANLRSEISHRKKEEDIAYAKLRLEQQKEKREADKSIRPTAEQLKLDLDEKAGLDAYREVKKVYDPSNYKDRLPITPVVAAVGKDLGYSPSEYDFYKVPAHINANKYVGVEAGENPVTTTTVGKDQTKTATTSKTAKGESLRPDMAVMIVNKKTNQGELVYVKDGQVVSKVSERDAIANGLKHEARYDDKIYSNKAIYGQHAYDQGAPTETKGAPTPTGIKKTIKGVTYEKYSDGQWY